MIRCGYGEQFFYSGDIYSGDNRLRYDSNRITKLNTRFEKNPTRYLYPGKSENSACFSGQQGTAPDTDSGKSLNSADGPQ